jgi:hypothetical protein
LPFHLLPVTSVVRMLVPSRLTSSTCILGVAVEDWSGRAAVALSADGQYVVIGASRNELVPILLDTKLRMFAYFAPGSKWGT